MQIYLALIYKLRLESYWWQNTFGLQRLFFPKCEKWSIIEWCTCRVWSTLMTVKGCISSPIQPSIFATVTYNHTELKFLFKLVMSAYGNHAPPLTLPKKIDFGKKEKKKGIKLLMVSLFAFEQALHTAISRFCTNLSVMCYLHRWAWLFYWPDRHCITVCSRTYVSSSVMVISKGKCSGLGHLKDG